jgi:hypothetical protein
MIERYKCQPEGFKVEFHQARKKMIIHDWMVESYGFVPGLRAAHIKLDRYIEQKDHPLSGWPFYCYFIFPES